ncbi:hypothetical protein PAE9249_00888 [Paenibacillus sp. CECT 9249]|nr:hypothetical protein PAE9249_00888 [Paenibacillus sp. CECT 9249]
MTGARQLRFHSKPFVSIMIVLMICTAFVPFSMEAGSKPLGDAMHEVKVIKSHHSVRHIFFPAMHWFVKIGTIVPPSFLLLICIFVYSIVSYRTFIPIKMKRLFLMPIKFTSSFVPSTACS